MLIHGQGIKSLDIYFIILTQLFKQGYIHYRIFIPQPYDISLCSRFSYDLYWQQEYRRISCLRTLGIFIPAQQTHRYI